MPNWTESLQRLFNNSKKDNDLNTEIECPVCASWSESDRLGFECQVCNNSQKIKRSQLKQVEEFFKGI